MPQHQMKLMSIIVERDNAVQERNVAMSEKKAALAERDLAFLQRDTAITERNNAIAERDSAIAALQYARENLNVNNDGHVCQSGCSAPKYTTNHHHNHASSHLNSSLPPQLSDVPYNNTPREMHITNAYPISSIPDNGMKPKRCGRPRKDVNKSQSVPSKKPKRTPTSTMKKKKGEDLNKQVTIAKSPWRGQQVLFSNSEDQNKMVLSAEHEWRVLDLGLNQVTFDETTMAVPGCSCTGSLKQCYKWGNGGWQSACCTTTLSQHPLPVIPNRRHARVGGRKMSGSVFTKLLSRLAQEGHDLSTPLDLKDHWAKHGTNRYITIK